MSAARWRSKCIHSIRFIPKMDIISKTCLVDFGWFASCKSIRIVSGRFYTKTENIFPEMSPKVAPVYFTVGFIIFLKRIFTFVNLMYYFLDII